MAIANHNEIDLLTIGGIRNDIRDSFTRAMVAPEEETDVATEKRYAGDYIILKSERKLYRVTQVVERGDTYVPGVNLERKSLGEGLRHLEDQSPESLLNIIGNYEPTGKATKYYSPGDRVILPYGSSPADGLLYKVTDVVTPGVTFVEHTNCERSMTPLFSDVKALEDAKMDVPTIIVQMLYAGATTMTFTNDAITDNCDIEVYTDKYGVSPRTMSQSDHTLNLTFGAQTTNIKVKIKVYTEV